LVAGLDGFGYKTFEQAVVRQDRGNFCELFATISGVVARRDRAIQYSRALD
jgi:hypothetical protein